MSRSKYAKCMADGGDTTQPDAFPADAGSSGGGDGSNADFSDANKAMKDQDAADATDSSGAPDWKSRMMKAAKNMKSSGPATGFAGGLASGLSMGAQMFKADGGRIGKNYTKGKGAK